MLNLPFLAREKGESFSQKNMQTQTDNKTNIQTIAYALISAGEMQSYQIAFERVFNLIPKDVKVTLTIDRNGHLQYENEHPAMFPAATEKAKAETQLWEFLGQLSDRLKQQTSAQNTQNGAFFSHDFPQEVFSKSKYKLLSLAPVYDTFMGIQYLKQWEASLQLQLPALKEVVIMGVKVPIEPAFLVENAMMKVVFSTGRVKSLSMNFLPVNTGKKEIVPLKVAAASLGDLTAERFPYLALQMRREGEWVRLGEKGGGDIFPPVIENGNIWIRNYVATKNDYIKGKTIPEKYDLGYEKIYEIIMQRLNKIKGIKCSIDHRLYEYKEPDKRYNSYQFNIVWDGTTAGYPKMLGEIFLQANPPIVIEIQNSGSTYDDIDGYNMGVLKYSARINRFWFYKRIFTDPEVSDLYILHLLTHELCETISLANNNWKFNYHGRDHPIALRLDMAAIKNKYPNIDITETRMYECVNARDEDDFMKISKELYQIDMSKDDPRLSIFSYKIGSSSEDNPQNFTFKNSKGEDISIKISTCGQTVEPPRIAAQFLAEHSEPDKLNAIQNGKPRYVFECPIKKIAVTYGVYYLYFPPESIGVSPNGSYQIIDTTKIIEYV